MNSLCLPDVKKLFSGMLCIEPDARFSINEVLVFREMNCGEQMKLEAWPPSEQKYGEIVPVEAGVRGEIHVRAKHYNKKIPKLHNCTVWAKYERCSER
jgi:hypothetical protein